MFVEFTKIYERLDIKDLIDRGESFYQNLMEDVVDTLEKKGMLHFFTNKYTTYCS